MFWRLNFDRNAWWHIINFPFNCLFKLLWICLSLCTLALQKKMRTNLNICNYLIRTKSKSNELYPANIELHILHNPLLFHYGVPYYPLCDLFLAKEITKQLDPNGNVTRSVGERPTVWPYPYGDRENGGPSLFSFKTPPKNLPVSSKRFSPSNRGILLSHISIDLLVWGRGFHRFGADAGGRSGF